MVMPSIHTSPLIVFRGRYLSTHAYRRLRVHAEVLVHDMLPTRIVVVIAPMTSSVTPSLSFY
jgi:hypothetical protein